MNPKACSSRSKICTKGPWCYGVWDPKSVLCAAAAAATRQATYGYGEESNSGTLTLTAHVTAVEALACGITAAS